jgi:hypothetical protein
MVGNSRAVGKSRPVRGVGNRTVWRVRAVGDHPRTPAPVCVTQRVAAGSTGSVGDAQQSPRAVPITGRRQIALPTC